MTLSNDVEMPVLGFGVFQVPPEDTERVVVDALAACYRSLDTAAAYRNEEAVGRAIATSGQDAGEENAKRAFDLSLERLGLDYLDLYLIHQLSATATAPGAPCSSTKSSATASSSAPPTRN